MRVIASQPVSPSTRMTEFSLRPNIVAIAIARMMYGMASSSVREAHDHRVGDTREVAGQRSEHDADQQ